MASVSFAQEEPKKTKDVVILAGGEKMKGKVLQENADGSIRFLNEKDGIEYLIEKDARKSLSVETIVTTTLYFSPEVQYGWMDSYQFGGGLRAGIKINELQTDLSIGIYRFLGNERSQSLFYAGFIPYDYRESIHSYLFDFRLGVKLPLGAFGLTPFGGCGINFTQFNGEFSNTTLIFGETQGESSFQDGRAILGIAISFELSKGIELKGFWAYSYQFAVNNLVAPRRYVTYIHSNLVGIGLNYEL
jgi:hypothetical protein